MLGTRTWEGLPKNFEEHREGLPRTFEEHREELPRNFEEHRERDCREMLRNIVRDCRAELCEGLPGKVGKLENSIPKSGRNDEG